MKKNPFVWISIALAALAIALAVVLGWSLGGDKQSVR